LTDDVIETEARPVPAMAHRPYYGAAGRPANPVAARRQLELARAHGRRALLVGIRRLTAYMKDPTTPIDATFLRAFAELSSRCGLPASTAQSIQADTTSITAALSGDDVEIIARRLLIETTEAEAQERIDAG